jgi:hypothetical protein
VERPDLTTPFGLQLVSLPPAKQAPGISDGLYLSKILHHTYPEVAPVLSNPPAAAAAAAAGAAKPPPGRFVKLVNGVHVKTIGDLQQIIKTQLVLRLMLR